MRVSTAGLACALSLSGLLGLAGCAQVSPPASTGQARIADRSTVPSSSEAPVAVGQHRSGPRPVLQAPAARASQNARFSAAAQAAARRALAESETLAAGRSLGVAADRLEFLFHEILKNADTTPDEKVLAELGYQLGVRHDQAGYVTGVEEICSVDYCAGASTISWEESVLMRTLIAKAIADQPARSLSGLVADVSLEGVSRIAPPLASLGRHTRYQNAWWVAGKGLAAIVEAGSPQEREIATLGLELGKQQNLTIQNRFFARQQALIEIARPSSSVQGSRLADLTHQQVARLERAYAAGPERFLCTNWDDARRVTDYGLYAIETSAFTTPQQKSTASKVARETWASNGHNDRAATRARDRLLVEMIEQGR